MLTCDGIHVMALLLLLFLYLFVPQFLGKCWLVVHSRYQLCLVLLALLLLVVAIVVVVIITFHVYIVPQEIFFVVTDLDEVLLRRFLSLLCCDESVIDLVDLIL